MVETGSKQDGPLKQVFSRYHEIHGPLLAKGLSFSFVLAGVPLLFILATIGSFIIHANPVSLLEFELLRFLPEEIRTNLMDTVNRYVSQPGSLSAVSVLILLVVVNTLFFDLYRSVSAAMGTSFSLGRGRLWATLTNTLFLLLIYGATLIAPAGRIIHSYVPLSPGGIAVLSRVVAIVITAVVLWGIFRIAADGALPTVSSILISLSGAATWHIVSGAGTLIIKVWGSRFFMYGVLAWAVFYLTFMRVLSEIIIHCSLWIYVYRRRSRPFEQSPPPLPDLH